MNATSTPEMMVNDISPFMMIFMFVSLLSVVVFIIYVVYNALRVTCAFYSSIISAKMKGDYNLQV